MTCDNTAAISVANFNLDQDSALLRQLQNIAADIKVSDANVTLPPVSRFEFNVGLGAPAATVRSPAPLDIEPPRTEATEMLPLQTAVYRAVRSAIDFSHTSPLVPPVEYVRGVGHHPTPDVNAPTPPLDYPISPLADVPSAPELDVSPVPSLTIGDRPALPPLSPITFTVQPVDLPPAPTAAVEMPNIDFVPELGYFEQPTYEDDAVLIAKLRDVAQADGEVLEWVSWFDVLHSEATRKIKPDAKIVFDKIFEQAAARNFALPTGSVDYAVAQAARVEFEQTRDATMSAHREITAAAWQAVLAAVRSAASVDRYHASLYVTYVKQNLAVYQANTQAAFSVMRALMALREVYGQIIAQHVANYNKYLAAVESQNAAQVAKTDLVRAAVSQFEAEVTMFQADVSGVRAAANAQEINVRQATLPLIAYEAQLRGVIANYSIFDTNVRAYSQAVQNFARSLELTGDKIAAFESAVRAESSKASVTEANVRTYARLLSAERQRAGSYEQYVRSCVDALEAEMANFRSAGAAERSYLMAVTDALASDTRRFAAYADIVRATDSVVDLHNQARIAATSAKDNLHLATEELRLARSNMAASAVISQTKLDSALAQVRVRAGGALAQAASTIYNVGVSATGSASHGVRGAEAGTQDVTLARRQSWSRECRQEERPLRG